MDNKGKQFKNSDFPNRVLCDWPIKWAILNQQTTKLKLVSSIKVARNY